MSIANTLTGDIQVITPQSSIWLYWKCSRTCQPKPE